MWGDDAAAMAAHRRARVALPLQTVHVIWGVAEDAPAFDPRVRGTWKPYTRPAWMPAIGERAVIVGGEHAGRTGVAGVMHGAHQTPACTVYLDNGPVARCAVDFVRREGTPVPLVFCTKRVKNGFNGLLAGDRLRVIGGQREGQTVTYIKRAGTSGPGNVNLYVLLEDGSRATVLAKFVERVTG
jgi:hypothetical protein